MTVLTVKQEAFCQAYIENGGNASEAYRSSYNAEKMKPEAIHVAACRLLADTKVALRVKQLRDAIEERHNITVDDLIAELEEARERAFTTTTPQLSAAIAATMGKAKMLGFLADKVEVTGKDGGAVQVDVTLTPEQAYLKLIGK